MPEVDNHNKENKMPAETLTKLITSDDRSGTLALYIYELNRRGETYRYAPVYFARTPNYGADEKPPFAIKAAVGRAQTEGREVRITNGANELVFHAKGETVLFPADPAEFWASFGL